MTTGEKQRVQNQSMALCSCNYRDVLFSLHRRTNSVPSIGKTSGHTLTLTTRSSSLFRLRSSFEASHARTDHDKEKRLSDQSSWEAKDAEGKDYLYTLGQEAENMNIAVGARKGVIDDLFVGEFLGKDCENLSVFYSFSSIKIY